MKFGRAKSINAFKIFLTNSPHEFEYIVCIAKCIFIYEIIEGGFKS